MGKRIRAHAHRYQGVALGATRRVARQAYLARRHCYFTQQGHMEAVASSYVAASGWGQPRSGRRLVHFCAVHCSLPAAGYCGQADSGPAGALAGPSSGCRSATVGRGLVASEALPLDPVPRRSKRRLRWQKRPAGSAGTRAVQTQPLSRLPRETGPLIARGARL